MFCIKFSGMPTFILATASSTWETNFSVRFAFLLSLSPLSEEYLMPRTASRSGPMSMDLNIQVHNMFLHLLLLGNVVHGGLGVVALQLSSPSLVHPVFLLNLNISYFRDREYRTVSYFQVHWFVGVLRTNIVHQAVILDVFGYALAVNSFSSSHKLCALDPVFPL